MAVFTLGNLAQLVVRRRRTRNADDRPGFVAGLPHGAYFGWRPLVANALEWDRRNRAKAVPRAYGLCAALTVATVIGFVPI